MKKIGILALAFVFALGALGVGYASWSKTLSVNASVETGSVNAEWYFVGCFDIEDKDVGTTTAWIDGADPQILHFSIDNGYPCYIGDCEVEFRYTGTVPVHLESIDFEAGPELTGCTVEQSPWTGTFTAYCDQLTVDFVDGLGMQLHQGDRLGSSVRVHIEQDAEMDSQYTFDIRILFVQYNESQFP